MMYNVIIYAISLLGTKHIGLRVDFNNAYRRVPSQPWRYSAVQCMLILVLITLMQLLENQHMDSYYD